MNWYDKGEERAKERLFINVLLLLLLSPPTMEWEEVRLGL